MNRKKVRFMDLSVAATLVLTVGIVAAISFGSSKAEYDVYEKQYNAEVEAIEKAKPAGPKSVYLDDDFVTYDENEYIQSSKSQFKNVKTIRAAEAPFSYNKNNQHNVKVEYFNQESIYGISLGGFDNVGGGSVTFNIGVNEASDADVTIDMACANYSSQAGGNTPINDLSTFIKISIDGIAVDITGIRLEPRSTSDWYSFHTLVLDDLHFKAGDNTIIIETLPQGASEHHVMPNLSHMHIFAESKFTKSININGDVMSLIKEDNKTYLTFVGTCTGYRETQLFMDLCVAGSSINVIPYNAYTCTIKDGFFLMKVDVSKLPTGRLYSHFFIDGTPASTGRAAGDILTKGFTSLYNNNWNDPKYLQTIDNYSLIVQNAQLVLEVK